MSAQSTAYFNASLLHAPELSLCAPNTSKFISGESDLSVARLCRGVEFWEKVGGVGTYQAFIDAVNEIGPEYKERIYREYLGIEPPMDLSEGKL